MIDEKAARRQVQWYLREHADAVRANCDSLVINYFVTSDGRDVFEVLDEALATLENSRLVLRVE
jgi:hypothetical protein